MEFQLSQLSFLPAGAASAVLPSVADIGPVGPASRTGSGGGDFAQVLTGETLRTQRQQLAALGTQTIALQVVPLGNSMNVITSDAPLPDMESLAQFARQQGLNESAVQALFGSAMGLPMIRASQAAGPLADLDVSDHSGAGPKPTAAPSASLSTETIKTADAEILLTTDHLLAVKGTAPWKPSATADLPERLAQFGHQPGTEAQGASDNAAPLPSGPTLETAGVEIEVLATPITPITPTTPITPITYATPQSQTPLAGADAEDPPGRYPEFHRQPQPQESLVSAVGTPMPMGQPMEGKNSGLSDTSASAADARRSSQSSSTDHLTNELTSALPNALPSELPNALPSVVPKTATSALQNAPPNALTNVSVTPANIGIGILAAPSAVLVAQAAAPLAVPAAAVLPSIEAAPKLAPGVVLAADSSFNLMPMTAQSWVGRPPSADATTAVNADAPTPDMRPQDALRLTLAMQAPEITKRLVQMSGTGKESTWAALLASGPLAKESMAPAAETMHLEVPPDYDLTLDVALAADASAQNDGLAAQSGSAAPQTLAQAAAGGSANGNANNAQAQAEHRAQQFQQMADQMGHAAAQRLIAQIERGQWKLQMRMQPAALGVVNVELDMHAGGLDASFSADNAIARELMAQGSNRLKETLADAGMTVASVTINRDQSRQSGGNSTPGKGRGASTFVGATGRVAPAAKDSRPNVTDMTPADGLNVLA